MEEPINRYANKRGYPESSIDLAPPGYPDGGYNKLVVIANPMLNQDQIWKLFDVIPSKLFIE